MNVIAGRAPATILPGVAQPRPATRFVSMRKATSLILALLAVTVAVATYGLYTALRGTVLQDQTVVWSACAMLVLLSIAVLLIGRVLTHRSMTLLESQLQRLTTNDQLISVDEPVPEDLRPVMQALFAYVGTVRNRLDRLRLQKKELDVQMRVAEVERQNTEAIIFSISDAVLVIDSFGELVLANAAGEKLFGFRFSDWRHRPIDRVLDDSTLASLLKDARAVRDHGVRRTVEYSALRNGQNQTFNITLSTVVDGNGQARGVVAVFHDITREREIAQIKTDFVSAVSHELRTPLSSIKAYVEMLVDGEAHTEETRKNFYKIIETETDRLQRLISNILNISRIESGVVEIKREAIESGAVIGEVLAMMKPQADEKSIVLKSEIAQGLPSVWADRDLLYQAVLNVVSNAIKYTPQDGHVRVAAAVSAETGSVSISVTDNGMGIRAQDLPRVFDKFFRTAESAGVAKGTGLGLNLVKHIVETVHQGEISVASEVGKGTTIVLRFPILKE